MSIVGIVAVALALGLFLWIAGVYLPADREGRRLPGRNERDAAVPVPILIDRSGTARPWAEVNPPATLRLA